MKIGGEAPQCGCCSCVCTCCAMIPLRFCGNEHRRARNEGQRAQVSKSEHPGCEVCTWLWHAFAEENHCIGLCLSFPSTPGDTLVAGSVLCPCAVCAALKSCSDLWLLDIVRQLIQKKRNVITLPLKRSCVPKQDNREPNNAQLHHPRCIGCCGL